MYGVQSFSQRDARLSIAFNMAERDLIEWLNGQGEDFELVSKHP